MFDPRVTKYIQDVASQEAIERCWDSFPDEQPQLVLYPHLFVTRNSINRRTEKDLQWNLPWGLKFWLVEGGVCYFILKQCGQSIFRLRFEGVWEYDAKRW
jgi:hypothetical protein